ncbi:MAG: nucleotidyltransferase domain-containing protein [Planctomycetaceae bacterium]|jgi:predicted nucleotidyltransferase|nr:nucleotidyltransferase domain-containing protein [Planctomycetaceae bacterium]
MTTTRDNILQILKKHKNHFVKKYNITKLGLFGSFARNEATDESDIDICFETVNSEPFLIVHFKTDLEEIFHRPIDLLQPHHYLRPALRKRLEQEVIYV